jgi:hypothetical protein
MKITHKQAVLAAALTGALTLTSAYAQTPDSVQTRIGKLSFEPAPSGWSGVSAFSPSRRD